MDLKKARVTPTGFVYDRFAQVSDSKGNYLTPRIPSCARLFHVRPSVANDDKGTARLHLAYGKDGRDEEEPFRIENLDQEIERSAIKEVTPISGPKVKLRDLGDDVAEWLSKVTGIEDCRLTAIGTQYDRTVEVNPGQGDAIPVLKETKEAPPVSLADEAPFLIASTSSLDDLNARLKARGKANVGMARFRPNIVVKGISPWEEDTWKRVRIGSLEFEVWQRCGRCSMTTIDRETLKRGPEPLATLSTFRERSSGQRNFGMHLIPILPPDTEGTECPEPFLNVGDTLEVLEYDEERLKEWKRLFGH
jgi:hypothetical protein